MIDVSKRQDRPPRSEESRRLREDEARDKCVRAQCPEEESCQTSR